MENKKFDLEQLANDWKSLYDGIKRNGKLNFELFENTFSDTYQLLCQKASGASIEKNLLPIITNAYLFAYADISDNIDSKYKASLVLTERMLRSIMEETVTTTSDESTIYVLELRREIRINFNDVSGSIEALAKNFESDYWNKLKA